MSLYDIRDNNYIQPNRFFSIRGSVQLIEREVKWTKIVLTVYSYNHINSTPNDKITIFFKGQTKKIVDKMLKHDQHCLVMGDIIVKDEKVFLDGKIIEIFKSAELVTEDNARLVDPSEVNYDKAF